MYGFSRGEISADSITVLPWHESFSSIPDRWILVDEMRERERERKSRRPRVSSSRSISLESAAVPENCSTWMAVRCSWNEGEKKGEKKKKKRKEKEKKRKEKERKGKERKGKEKGKEEGNGKKDGRDG